MLHPETNAASSGIQHSMGFYDEILVGSIYTVKINWVKKSLILMALVPLSRIQGCTIFWHRLLKQKMNRKIIQSRE